MPRAMYFIVRLGVASYTLRGEEREGKRGGVSRGTTDECSKNIGERKAKFFSFLMNG